MPLTGSWAVVFNRTMPLFPASVFTYGTLMLPEVMQAVMRSVPAHAPATLVGYRRALLRDRVYPGILPEPRGQVEGICWSGITEPQLAQLDAFEADEYLRVEERVVAADAPRRSAFVYVIAPAHAELMTQERWDADGFRARHLATYLGWSGS